MNRIIILIKILISIQIFENSFAFNAPIKVTTLKITTRIVSSSTTSKTTSTTKSTTKPFVTTTNISTATHPNSINGSLVGNKCF